MTKRPPYLDKLQPASFKLMQAWRDEVNDAAHRAGVSEIIAELIAVRVSQINGCAYCLDVHTRKSLAVGEDARRLSVLPAWRESEWFDDDERTALAVAESVTTLPQADLREAIEADARARYGDDWFGAVEWLAIVMNANNRLSVVSRHRIPSHLPPVE